MFSNKVQFSCLFFCSLFLASYKRMCCDDFLYLISVIICPHFKKWCNEQKITLQLEVWWKNARGSLKATFFSPFLKSWRPSVAWLISRTQQTHLVSIWDTQFLLWEIGQRQLSLYIKNMINLISNPIDLNDYPFWIDWVKLLMEVGFTLWIRSIWVCCFGLKSLCLLTIKVYL